MLAPKSYDKPPKVLIVNEEGKFEIVPYDENDDDMKIRLDDLLRNTAAVCGVLRHGCEQAFGSLRQFGALAKALSQNANRPIGVRIVLKYGLNKAYTNVNRHVMMYLLCCLMHNTTHKKFPIKYATEEGQKFIFNQIKLLLPTCNWTTMDNIQLSFDTSKCPHMNDHEGYMVCNLENFDHSKAK